MKKSFCDICGVECNYNIYFLDHTFRDPVGSIETLVNIDVCGDHRLEYQEILKKLIDRFGQEEKP